MFRCNHNGYSFIRRQRQETQLPASTGLPCLMAGCRWNKMISFVLILVYKYWHILVWTYVFKCDQMKWYKMTHLAVAPEAKGCELKVIAELEYTWEQEYKSAGACEYSTAVSENKSTWETVFSFAWATLYVQLYSYMHLCVTVFVHASVWLRTVNIHEMQWDPKQQRHVSC